MNEHQLEVLRSLLEEYERQACDTHLHQVAAYRNAVRLLRANGVKYQTPESRLVD